MAFDKAMAHLKTKGFGDRVIVPQEETATVEEAAAALGTAPAQIAKTMAFDVDGTAVLVLCAGTRVSTAPSSRSFSTVNRIWYPVLRSRKLWAMHPAASAPLALTRACRCIWTSRLSASALSTRPAATTTVA